MDRRTSIRLQLWFTAGLIVACAALAGWLTTQYGREFDVTATGRHTLSDASRAVLALLDGPVTITAYARPDPELRGSISHLVERYRGHKPDLDLHFLDPDEVPDQVREQGVGSDGELVVAYGGRSEHVTGQTEQALTNALQTLARGQERYVVFVEGHGERAPLGQANHDVSQWAARLQARGLKVQSLNLATAGAVPDNTAVLVLASPRVALLPAELAALEAWTAGGGNLLWLTEPDADPGLAPLAAALGIEVVPGTIVDPATRAFAIDNAAFALVTAYPVHAATAGFRYVSVFPFAAALATRSGSGWDAQALLSTGDGAWSETGALEGDLRYDEGGDFMGPLTLGYALTRERAAADGGTPAQQRAVVIGDGDFLSNTYLGNGGNLDLGVRLVEWLARDEQFVSVPARTARDLTFDLSEPVAFGLAAWFLIGCPLLLLGIAGWIGARRRRA